jgi:hypothetical protein
LDDSSGGSYDVYPPLSYALYQSLPLFALWDADNATDSVTAQDSFAVLGERGTRYYIAIMTDTPYQYRYGYVEKKSVHPVARAVSAAGTLKTTQTLYAMQGNDLEPQSLDTVAPAGTTVQILGSFSTVQTTSSEPYVCPQDPWLYCIVDLGTYGNFNAYLPLSAVTYDPEIEIVHGT